MRFCAPYFSLSQARRSLAISRRSPALAAPCPALAALASATVAWAVRRSAFEAASSSFRLMSPLRVIASPAPPMASPTCPIGLWPRPTGCIIDTPNWSNAALLFSFAIQFRHWPARSLCCSGVGLGTTSGRCVEGPRGLLGSKATSSPFLHPWKESRCGSFWRMSLHPRHLLHQGHDFGFALPLLGLRELIPDLGVFPLRRSIRHGFEPP